MSAVTELITEIGDESQPLKHARLLELSSLDSLEKADFVSTWPTVSPERRRDIVVSLAGMAEEDLQLDFSALFIVGLGDPDEQVREKAALALWECDDRAVILPLTELLGSDPSSDVRTAVAIALGKFATMAHEGRLIAQDRERVRNALLTAIDASGQVLEVRRRALESAASFGDPRVDDLISRSHESGDDAMKQSAIFAMGRSPDDRWVATVVRDLSDSSPAIRFEAVNALSLIGDEDTSTDLIRLLEDEDPEVQSSAAKALGNIGGGLAKQALHDSLADADEALEEAVREALDEIAFDEDPLGGGLGPGRSSQEPSD